MPPDVITGAESWSYVPDDGAASGVLVLHGFTGNPSSVRGVARAVADAGHHVELPRLPGHGTTLDDMQLTGWSEWVDAVASTRDLLAERTDSIVIAGLSMGGALALHAALDAGSDQRLRGLVCINPPTRAQPPEVIEMLREFLDEQMTVVPGGGADIADPDAVDLSYSGTPVGPLLSLQLDGLTTIQDRYGEISVPLRLLTSRHDHVVDPSDSEHLVASYGGEVDHTWLERSFHVATLDHDRALVDEAVVAFVDRVTGAADRMVG